MGARPDPISEFLSLLQRAKREVGEKAIAATLATADTQGRPSARVVLVKQVDQRGFVFYTNRQSRKAADLLDNPRAALCFYWLPLDKQVRVEGTVEEVDDEQSDAYFALRPRGSQVGAWASKQSAVMASRRELILRYLRYRARFAGRPVPRPPFWGGFRLLPQRIEIWHNQAHRLHDRLVFLREGDGWRKERLYP